MVFKKLSKKLIGKWKGEYILILNPTAPSLISQSECQISEVVMEKYIQFSYIWEYEGKDQEGLLIVGYDEKKEKILMSWVDSWHQSTEFMVSEGSFLPDGSISAKGSYPAPDGPNWGWETKIIPNSEGRFTFEMYNITPTGDEHLAVEVEYSKNDS